MCPNRGTQARPPAFSEQEIRSRTWQEGAEVTLQLLEWSEMEFQFHGRFLIAKYGKTDTGYVTCLDIYKVNDLGEGPEGVIPTYASALLTQAVPPSVIISNRRSFDLIAHDNGREFVKAIQTDETPDGLIITITRQTIPKSTKEPMRLRYRLRYSELQCLYSTRP